MKIAISGKGGVGKTTLAGVMARCLSKEGHKVLAIDADPDANLASALGIGEELLRDVRPLAEMTEFIEERTGAKKGEMGSFFRLNPKVDDIPERFAIEKDGVKLVILGSIPQGGGGCFCAENVLLKSLLSHVLIEREEYVIVDMEAGLEHLGRGSTAYIDAMLVVVEPGQRSLRTARHVRKLAADLAIPRVYAVGNRISHVEEAELVRERLEGIPLLGVIGYHEKIMEADRLNLSPYDLDGTVREEVEAIIGALRGNAG